MSRRRETFQKYIKFYISFSLFPYTYTYNTSSDVCDTTATTVCFLPETLFQYSSFIFLRISLGTCKYTRRKTLGKHGAGKKKLKKNLMSQVYVEKTLSTSPQNERVN